ncbi:hypothetical protein BH18ACT1_BH18ACT1_12690 [soil metagenome]
MLAWHTAWAWVVIGANAMAGAWALGAHRVPALRRREMWWFTVAAELTVVVQVLLGVALVAGEDRDAGPLHQLYGYAGFVAIGILYSYRGQLRERLYLLYGFGGLFLMGLGIRALFLDMR